MIKPKRLERGDTVAIVSLSSGMLGDKPFLHKYALGKQRLEEEYGFKVITMPNTLKGSEYLYEHPEKRAQDLMDAFSDKSIKAIFTAIGGDDAIRLLPYIDYGVIRNNPKIFTGYSDTTANHLMMFKAGIVSFYGAAFMTEFAEYGAMSKYSSHAFQELLIKGNDRFGIEKSSYWIKEEIPWDEKNINMHRAQVPDKKGYEVIQGEGSVSGKLLGGCLDAFPLYNGTEIWPTGDDWNDTILFLETSEDCSSPTLLSYYLRNLGAQGVFDKAKGIIVGKPAKGKYYREYKGVYRKILKEFHREDMPVLYNVNFGHCAPITIIPYGICCRLDVDNKRITLLESAVE